MAQPFTVTFTAGQSGDWRIERLTAVAGESLPAAMRLSLANETAGPAKSSWQLRGVVSYTRYTIAEELKRLNAVSPPLGRPEATCAALIPIRKSDAWWSMAQDERRAIFEEGSGHIAKSMSYLPAIARRLHHARDLGEPFDFLTWFEYAPQHVDAFEALVAELRASEEWRYVEREVDIRLRRVVL
jgi:chlorite dismutase